MRKPKHYRDSRVLSGRRSGAAAPRRALVLLGLVAALVPVAGMRTARADDRVLVPRATERWRSHLAAALEAIRSGGVERGLAGLQEAILDDGGALFEIRDEDLLDDPLASVLDEGPLAVEQAAPQARPARLLPGRPLVIGRPRAPPPEVKPRRFVALADVALAVLEHLPVAVRVEYREKYDARAAELLEPWREGGDTRALEAVVDRFLFTSSGAGAAEALGDVEVEAGRVGPALRRWRQALRSGRVTAELAAAESAEATGSGEATESVDETGDARRARLLVKIARALRFAGRAREADLARAGLTAARGAAVDLGPLPPGAPAVTGAASDSAASDSAAFVAKGLIDAVPLPGDERESAPGRRGDRLSLELPRLPSGALEISWANDLWVRQKLPPEVLAHLPVVEGRNLYIGGPRHIHRVDARPGRGALRKEFVKPGRSLDFVPDNLTQRYAPVFWRRDRQPLGLLGGMPEGVLLGSFIEDVVGHDEYHQYTIRAELPIRGLIAFDASRGRPLWRTRERALVDEAARLVRRRQNLFRGRDEKDGGRSASVKGFSYHSSVVVRDGLVVVGGWRQRGFVTSAVRALDLRDGSLVWETVVSSAQIEQTMFGELAREPFPGAILERDGVVYYCGQLGTVTALDLATGRPRWAATYESIPVESTLGPFPTKRRLRWGPSSLLLVDHTLIVAPRDSAALWAFDTGDGPEGEAAAGRLLWKYSAPPRGDREHLLGHRAGWVYVSVEDADGAGVGDVLRLDIQHRDRIGRLRSSTRFAGATRHEPRVERTKGGLGVTVSTPGALTDRGIVIVVDGRLALVSHDLSRVEKLSDSFAESELAGSDRDADERSRNDRRLVAPFSFGNDLDDGWPESPRGTLVVAGGLVILTTNERIIAFAPVMADPPSESL